MILGTRRTPALAHAWSMTTPHGATVIAMTSITTTETSSTDHEETDQ